MYISCNNLCQGVTDTPAKYFMSLKYVIQMLEIEVDKR